MPVICRLIFRPNFRLFPDNAVLPVSSEGNIDFSPSSSLVLFSNGANSDLGRIQKIPSIELSSLYKGWDNHLLRLGAGFRYEEITTSESRNFGYGEDVARSRLMAN